MTTTLDISNLVLNDVHRLLKLEFNYSDSLTPFLPLQPLTEMERRRLEEINANFQSYFFDGYILEGLVKVCFSFDVVIGFFSP